MKNWLKSLVLAGVVAGTVTSANAAMWTDEAGFLTAMIPGYFFTQENPTLVSGQTYTDEATDYGYTVGLSRGNYRLTFTSPPTGPAPTGVGGFFNPGTSLTFTFSDGSTQRVVTDAVTGFGGYTTDVPPELLSIKNISFASINLPSSLHVGLDIVLVPEATTMLAGALLLLPFAFSTIRRARKTT
jgi:hypothetical protein